MQNTVIRGSYPWNSLIPSHTPPHTPHPTARSGWPSRKQGPQKPPTYGAVRERTLEVRSYAVCALNLGPVCGQLVPTARAAGRRSRLQWKACFLSQQPCAGPVGKSVFTVEKATLRIPWDQQIAEGVIAQVDVNPNENSGFCCPGTVSGTPGSLWGLSTPTTNGKGPWKGPGMVA